MGGMVLSAGSDECPSPVYWVEPEIDKTYSKFREKGIGPVEFPIAKRIFKRETNKQLKNPTSVAFTISDAVRNGFDNNYAHDMLDNIDNLARGDTNRLINESFPEYEQLLKIIVTPDDKACLLYTSPSPRD